MDAAGHTFILPRPHFLALNRQHSFLLTLTNSLHNKTSIYIMPFILYFISISISIPIQEVLLRELKQTSSGDNMTSSSAGGTNNNREGGGRVSGGKMNKR